MLEPPSYKVVGLQLYQKQTPAQTFSSEYREIFKSTFFEKHLRILCTFLVFSELRKIWKCNLKNYNFPSLWWIGQSLEIYTAPGQHFKILILNLWMSLENLCPNLSFTVENKMENSHKRGWSHFKLKINDWDIPSPKILRICQWPGKNVFHWGKWNEPIKFIRECVRLKIKI